jgi:hypothetical protein
MSFLDTMLAKKKFPLSCYEKYGAYGTIVPMTEVLPPQLELIRRLHFQPLTKGATSLKNPWVQDCAIEPTHR